MKNEMMIILKPDDSMEKMAYIKGKSLWKAVDGSIEHFLETKLRTLSGNLLTVDFYCNEEFAVIDDEKFEKLNALASLISGQEIRGNVAVVVYAGGGENRGFYDEPNNPECADAMLALKYFFEEHLKEINALHEKYDNHKSEPQFSVFYLDDSE